MNWQVQMKIEDSGLIAGGTHGSGTQGTRN